MLQVFLDYFGFLGGTGNVSENENGKGRMVRWSDGVEEVTGRSSGGVRWKNERRKQWRLLISVERYLTNEDMELS